MSYIDYVEQLNLLCTAKISVNTENVCFAGKPKEQLKKREVAAFSIIIKRLLTLNNKIKCYRIYY
jgi:hypothetical protein